MRRWAGFNKERCGALILILTGAAVTAQGASYHFGALNHMGAGFIPVVLGVLLTAMGIAIGATAGPGGVPVPKPEWRGWLCILGGVAAFVVLGNRGGLVPAAFASVFISALGDRNNRWRDAALLAAVMTVLGVLVFSWGLKLQLPLFQWV